MEEARYVEVAEMLGGTLERERSNTTCSARTSVQHLHIVQQSRTFQDRQRHTRKTAPSDTPDT